METLPAEYIPISLRPQEKIPPIEGITYYTMADENPRWKEDPFNHYRFVPIAGSPLLQKMLDTVPVPSVTRDTVIIAFRTKGLDESGQEIFYRWNKERKVWIKEKQSSPIL